MEARVLYRGSLWTIYVLFDGTREEAREFVATQLTKEQQDKLKALLRRSADNGLPSNTEKFRQLSPHPISEFKIWGVRLLCFFNGPGRVVLTHGFKKKSIAATPQSEIDRALRMRALYQDGKRDRDER